MVNRNRYPTQWPTPEQFEGLAFAAGIIAGEGCVNSGSRPTADGRREIHFSVMMQCHESVEAVARALSPYMPTAGQFTLGVNVAYQKHNKDGIQYARIHITGSKAQVAVRVLWPWLKRTDKAGQALEAFDRAGLTWPHDWKVSPQVPIDLASVS